MMALSATGTTDELYGWSVEDLVSEIVELREALERAEDDLLGHQDCYSAEEHEETVERTASTVEADIRYELRVNTGPDVEDAHALLNDWAWRAVNGDAAAQAAEREAGPLLKRIRDQYAS